MSSPNAAAAVAQLGIWGDRLDRLGRYALEHGPNVLVILIVGLLVYRAGAYALDRLVGLQARLGAEGEPTHDLLAARKRTQTAAALLHNALKYLVFFLGFYLLLAELVGPGRLGPLVAGAGIAGLAIGFGAQSLVKDWVSGFFILFEGQYSVGDMVHLKAGPYEAFGIVEELGLRSTTVRDLHGNLHYMPNGTILGVDRYAKGYLRFHVELVVKGQVSDAQVAEMLDSVGRFFEHQPLLLVPPRLVEITSLRPTRSVITLEVFVVPFQDWLVERVGDLCAGQLQEMLGLEDPPPHAQYLICEQTLDRYRESIILPAGEGRR